MRRAAIMLAAFLLLSCCLEADVDVKPGLEVFLEGDLSMVEGKNVGLIINPVSVSRNLETTVELLIDGDINLVALYGPEHGVRGNAQAGEYVPFYWDDKYDLPVFSLYGQTQKPPEGMLENIDEFMRTYDTQSSGKIPEGSMVESVDVMLFDLQDIGTRIYTYVATMAYAMRTCAELGIEFIVLDRPNPLGGEIMEGPILEYPEYSSFVGLYPIPMRHGMTAGELAMLFNDRFFDKKVDLMVIPMEGWERDMWFDDTHLPWILPSPNMPTLSTATVYPGQVLIEGTTLSEGRGTTTPFEIFGAPWIDGYELTENLNDLNLPGVRFKEHWFTPTFSKHAGELCGGVMIVVTNREIFRPFETTLHILRVIMDTYPGSFEFHCDYFDRLVGNAWMRESLRGGVSVEEIVSSCKNGLKDFSDLRENYLLYD